MPLFIINSSIDCSNLHTYNKDTNKYLKDMPESYKKKVNQIPREIEAENEDNAIEKYLQLQSKTLDPSDGQVDLGEKTITWSLLGGSYKFKEYEFTAKEKLTHEK